MGGIKDLVSRAVLELKYLPTQLELAGRVKKIEKEEQRIIEQGIREVEKRYPINNENVQEYITSLEYTSKMEVTLKVTSCVEKMLDANRWISYCIYYATYPKAKRLQIEDKEIGEFVNGILAFFGFGHVYKKYEIADIIKFDVSRGNDCLKEKFILSIDALWELEDNELVEKFEQRKVELGICSEQRGMCRELGSAQLLKEIILREPFIKHDFIGFRKIKVNEIERWRGDYGKLESGEKFLFTIVELIEADTYKKYFMYYDKAAYKKFYDRYKGQIGVGECFFYSVETIGLVLDALKLTYPQFDEVTYIVDDGKVDHFECVGKGKFDTEEEYSVKKIKLLKDSVFARDDIRQEKEVQDLLIRVYENWSKNDYSQIFEKEPTMFWKDKILTLEVLVNEEQARVREEENEYFKEQRRAVQEKIEEAGKEGEKEVEYQLQWLPDEYIVVDKGAEGICLKQPGHEENLHEIDHIVIGPQGVFNIETKMYSGTISIDEQGNWLRKKGTTIEGARNPIEQIGRHHMVLEKILGIVDIHDIICIACDKAIIEGAENSKVPIVKSDMLVYTLKNYNTEKCYSVEEREKLQKLIEQYRV